MKKETKQTLISLSLAGAIGYYLYSKLVKAGMSSQVTKENGETAEEKTKRELSWRPEPVVEEPIMDEISEQEEIVENVDDAHVIHDEEAVDTEIVDEPPVDEEVVEQPELTIDSMQAEEVVEQKIICPSCDGANPEGNETCNFCGALLTANTEESDTGVQEDVVATVDNDVLVTPVLDFENLNLGEAEAVENTEMALEVASEIQEPAEEISLDAILDADKHEDEETAVEDLFSAIQADEPQESEEKEKVMENVEPLHKVDQKSESAKKEFKSIMDFFKTL